MLYRGAALFLMFTDQGDQKHLKIKENLICWEAKGAYSLTCTCSTEGMCIGVASVCRPSVMILGDHVARSSILSVKLICLKKDMACELEVKDTTTRLGESFPMDLMGMEFIWLVKDNVTGIKSCPGIIGTDLQRFRLLT